MKISRRSFLISSSIGASAVLLVQTASHALPINHDQVGAPSFLDPNFVHRDWHYVDGKWTNHRWQQNHYVAELSPTRELVVHTQSHSIEMTMDDYRAGYAQDVLSRYFEPTLCEEVLREWILLSA